MDREDELGIDESMEETLAAMKERDAEPEVIVDEPKAEDPIRDEDGKFAKDEPPVEEDITLDAPVDDPVVPEVVPEPVVASEHINAPTAWTPEAKAKWAELPEWARGEVHRRELASNDGVQQLKESASFGNQINSILDPYRATIRAKGVESSQVVETMLNAYHVLETAAPQAKAKTLLDTAQQYGCLNEIIGLLSNNTQGQPQVTQDQVPQLVNQQVEQILSQWEEQSQAESAQQAVKEFASATDAEGRLTHPYFNDVRNQMVGIVQAAESTSTPVSLDEAYEQAIWANPATRPLLQAQQSEQLDKDRQDQEKARLEAAKKSQKTNIRTKPSHASAEQPEPTGSISDTMEETLAKIRADAA